MTAQTYTDILQEALRRAFEDDCPRVICLSTGANYQIRLLTDYEDDIDIYERILTIVWPNGKIEHLVKG